MSKSVLFVWVIIFGLLAPIAHGDGSKSEVIKGSAAQTLIISGTVVASNGQLLANREVRLFGPLDDLRNGSIHRRVRTQLNGSYSVGGLRSGIYQLSVSSATERLMQISCPAGSTDARIQLPQVELVRGVVADQKGAPLANVSLNLKSRFVGDDYLETVSKESVTDRNGSFALYLYKSKKYKITVSKPGYISATIDFDATKPSTETQSTVALKLAKGHSLQGCVTYAGTAIPAEGVIVKQIKRGVGWYGEKHKKGDYALSDGNGKFTLKGLPSGICVVAAYYPTKRPIVPVAIETVDTTQSSDIVFEIPKSGHINIALDNFKNAPNIDLKVVDQPYFYWDINSDKSTEQISFKNIVAGDYFLTSDVYTNSGWQKRLHPKRITIKPDTTLDLALDFNEPVEGLTLTGQLAGLKRPLKKGQIYVEPKSQDVVEGFRIRRFNERVAKVDESGGFTLYGMHAGDFYYTVTEKNNAVITGHFSVAAAQKDLKIAVDGLDFSGVIRDAESKPLSKVWLTLGLATDEARLNDRTVHATSDEQGRFSFYGIAPGTYNLNIRSHTYGIALREVIIEEDQEDFAITLEHGASISGTALDAQSQLLTGGSVTLFNEHDQASMVHLPADGSFKTHWKLEKNRDYTLYVYAPGHALQAMPFKLTKDRIENFRLLPGGNAKIKLASKKGPLNGRQIRLIDKTEQPVPHRTTPVQQSDRSIAIPLSDKRGHVLVKHLLPGSYTASIEGVAATQQFAVTALETAEVEFVID